MQRIEWVSPHRNDAWKFVTFRDHGKKFMLVVLPQAVRDVKELPRKILVQEQDAHASPSRRDCGLMWQNQQRPAGNAVRPASRAALHMHQDNAPQK
jgi:hypothetical protein